MTKAHVVNILSLSTHTVDKYEISLLFAKFSVIKRYVVVPKNFQPTSFYTFIF